MTLIKSIDINCDMGELIDGKPNYDADILPHISSCNISCGFHSGSAEHIENTIINALKYTVAIGAHPSYLDRKNFGRKSLDIPISELKAQIKYQVAAIKGLVESHGGSLHHVKTHGALYNDMHKNVTLGEHIIESIQQIQKNTPIFVMAESALVDICNKKGIPYVQEIFSDRAYENINSLMPRQHDGSVISDVGQIIERVNDFINMKLIDSKGNSYDIIPDTICVHSDTPHAVDIASAISRHLKSRNIEISSYR